MQRQPVPPRHEASSASSITEIRSRTPRRLLIVLAILLGPPLLLLLILLGMYFRANGSRVHPDLACETWPAVADGMHNSNTDLIYWQNFYYLVHASSPYHFASEDCRLKLWRSTDCREWTLLREFYVPGEDIRDPKFAPISGRLFLYVLKNTEFAAEPYTTQYTYTDTGAMWEPFRDAEPKGWLFWRPKSPDGRTWYVPAYWHQHGKSILLQSRNGQQWTEVSTIHEGNRNDETDITFLPDGRILATARLEESDSYFGHKEARTLIAVSEPPYTQWSKTTSYVTRLDGPCLFTYNGQAYAIGRHNPDPPRPLNYHGSILGRKRTAIYKVSPDGMEWLTDLPSAGDTSYAGIVQQGHDLYISYYTSPIQYDWPWLLGMLARSDIRIAKINLPTLEKIANHQGH